MDQLKTHRLGLVGAWSLHKAIDAFLGNGMLMLVTSVSNILFHYLFLTLRLTLTQYSKSVKQTGCCFSGLIFLSLRIWFDNLKNGGTVVLLKTEGWPPGVA